MKKACLLSVVALFITVVASATGVEGATRVVDDDGRASAISCEGGAPAPRTIQGAIDLSASGDTILVCPGFYPEQLKIVAKTLTIRGVTSGAQNLVLIKPIGISANSTNAYSGAPIAAIIAVEDSASVLLRNLTIDGLDNGLTECNPLLVGIFYRNASGNIEATAIRDIRLGEDDGGCQGGIGVFTQSSTGATSKVTITGSSIHRYQKAGVVGNEVGTELLALDNSIGADDATSPIARNGIQIGFGATGTITDNAIANHVRTCPAFDCDVSTSVLIFEADGITINRNHTAQAVIGIYLVRSNNSLVRNNLVFGSVDRDGIAVIGDNNRVQRNSISSSGEFGLYVEGDGNRLERNTINEAPCGIFAGTTNSLLDNSVFNTELTTCEPFSLARMALSLQSKGASTSGAAGLQKASGATTREVTPVR
jgi:parallel beta-helix repeat protein